MRPASAFAIIATCLFMLFYGSASYSALIETPQSDIPVAEEDIPFWEKENTPLKLVNLYEHRLPFFKLIDQNADWLLSDDEIVSFLLARFKAFDANRDAEWDEQELDKLLSAFSTELALIFDGGNERRARRLRIRMEECDANENDMISWTEYYKCMRHYYKVMDSNGDDDVEFIEFRTIDDKLSPVSGGGSSRLKVPEYK
mgnify:CR=1 FL=1|tara:strand:- start:225471 stop:226070 length:600 start_codon:yes stop_codon:yes gene_type:complete